VDPIVQLRQAGVSLGGSRVLTDIDLDIESGRVVGVAGPNGSGKTTLVRTVATLTSIDSGTARILGVDLDGGGARRVRSQIGLIGHNPALISELTLAENLEHVARLGGMDTARVPRALDVVGLAEAAERRASACSFGMLRRVEVAHLLMTRPRLLLLDEAASGLDDSARDLIAALVDSVRERGGGALVVSHDRSHLATLCDDVLTLSRGSLVAT
jgi:heme exporter protein A